MPEGWDGQCIAVDFEVTSPMQVKYRAQSAQAAGVAAKAEHGGELGLVEREGHCCDGADVSGKAR